jgi:uncharacterized phosphosugar-binding protein
MDNYVDQYLTFAIDLLQRIARDSGAAIRQAAEAVANAIEHDGMFYLFGSGHSALAAKDSAYRAGGLAPALAIDDVAEGDAERVEGLAKYILSRYDLRPNSVIAIISNSGINPTPIETALLTKQMGLSVVVITSLVHSQSVASRHSSGKKLYEVADIVIDTHGAAGDAAIQLPGSELKSGATSTVAGSAILQAITVQAAALLVERGLEAPIWVSANVPGGDTHNNRLLERYRPRLARYQMAVLPAFKSADQV